MSDTPGSTPPPRTTGGNWRWEPPTPEELQRILPQYEVDKLIGRGGMGAVYRGVQLSLERPVAIKVLPPAVEQQDAAFAERFRNEAKVMGRMNHPAIVSVYDFGRTAEGQLYFVMEYVDGTDVQQMIATHGKLPPEHALAVTAHLCDALGYAHKQGVVHRDIKPSNVLIDSDGRVKVADFGLAKLTGNLAQTRGLTQTGLAMGTPDYVAPESLTLGMEVDGRADLYAVGVMLYQMLTGDIPRGMFKMPSQKVAGVDPRFDRIVRRALEHDREERYQSSGEIRHDLDVILSTPLAETGRQSSAALPKHLAAQVPGRTVVPKQGPRRPNPPPEPFYEERKPSPTWPYVLAIVLILAAGGWAVFHRPARTAPIAEPEPKEEKPTPVVVVPPTPPPKTEPVKPVVTPTPTPTPTPPTPLPVKPLPVVVTPTPPANVPPGVPPAPLPMATNTSAIVGAGMPTAPRLLLLEDIFQDEFDAKVNGVYNAELKDLGTKYLARLEADLSIALRNRQSADAKALEDEKVRFQTHQFMPSIDPPSLPRIITNLRDIYRTTEKALVQQKDANSLPYYDRFINALNLLEKEAIEQRRTSDADKIRSKREDVIARRKQRAAKVPANMLPRASSAENVRPMNLFDGQTLKGWRVVGDADSFTVSNGEIRSSGRRGNLIFIGTNGTPPIWKDFILDIKIKCPDRANSGIWLHIPEPTTIINRKVSAFEVNIDERGKGTTGDILATVDISSGAPMNGLLQPGKKPYLSSPKSPPSAGRFDQWQSLRIMAKAGVFTVWIDGQQVNQWSFPSGWAPPPNSNYVQTFAGTIGLQSGAGVAFKDITVQTL